MTDPLDTEWTDPELIIVDLYDTKSGQRARHRREHRQPIEEGDGFWDFLWSLGNNSCDCNRSAMMLQEGASFPDDELVEGVLPCGDGRIVLRITTEAGTELYRDGDWVQP